MINTQHKSLILLFSPPREDEIILVLVKDITSGGTSLGIRGQPTSLCTTPYRLEKRTR
jgi:hypothetical protein